MSPTLARPITPPPASPRVRAPAEPRCSGGVQLGGSAGAFRSGPANKRYCSWQECMWHVALDTDDIIVLKFTRLDIECVTNPQGVPYDYAKVYDGVTVASPLLATFFCSTHYAVATSGPHLLLHFHTDELYNYFGFEAIYKSGRSFCSGFSSCSSCATGSSNVCGWCRVSHKCLPRTGPLAVCPLNAWSVFNASTCCPAGWSGANCDVCAPGFYGASCTPCACGPGGTCFDGLSGNGTCACTNGWTGALCDASQPKYWGNACSACTCVGGSTCIDGRNGTGCACLPSYYGPSCLACGCPVNSSLYFAQCADGLSGSGQCSCATGFIGVSTGCATCAPGRYGVSCAPCDCPVNTVCAQGIGGSGCRCSSPLCEEDATLHFLALVATDFYSGDAPHVHEVLDPPFSASLGSITSYVMNAGHVSYDITSMSIVAAPNQWGSRLVVTALNNGASTVLCNASIGGTAYASAHEAFELRPLGNASAAMEVLAGLQGYPALLDGTISFPQLMTSHLRLLRSCAFTPQIGPSTVAVRVTAPNGLVAASYIVQLNREPSADCALAALSLVASDSNTGTTRPNFATNTLTYTAAMRNTTNELFVSATTRHSVRCAGVYNGVRCLVPAQLRVVLRHVNGSVLSDSGYAFNHSISLIALAPPLGRSTMEVMVLSESDVLGTTSAEQASGRRCGYNVSLARGLSRDVTPVSLAAIMGFANSSNSTPQSLSVSLLPPFSFATGAAALTRHSDGNLVVSLPNEVTRVQLQFELPVGATAQFECTACASLPVGVSNSLLLVTAEDLTHMASIFIRFNRLRSSDCRLRGLRLYHTDLRYANNLPAYPYTPSRQWGANVFGTSPVNLVHALTNAALWVKVMAEPFHYLATASYTFPTSDAAPLRPTVSGGVSSAPNWTMTDLRPSIGNSSLNVTVTAEDGTRCLVNLALERPRSTDVSLADISLFEWRADYQQLGNEWDLLPLPTTSCGWEGWEAGAAGAPPSLASSMPSSCFQVSMPATSATARLALDVTTSHSNFCEIANHACAGNSRIVLLSPPGISVQYQGIERGERGELVAIMSVPPGSWALTILTFAEAGNWATTQIFVSRSLSNDARLSEIWVNLGNCERCEQHVPDSPNRYFLVDLDVGAVLTLNAKAMPDSLATVTVNGNPPPWHISVRRQRTFVYVVVRAQNQLQMNYTVEIQCRSCREIGDSELDMVVPQPAGYGSQMWLMLVLLVAAVTLCCLSLLVCVRMQFLRVQQRREMLRRYPPVPVLPPEELMRRLAPYLCETVCKASDKFEDACSICLGELEESEELTTLPCKHIFHKECIHGWLVHKGIVASCPLCKALVAPGLVIATQRQQPLASPPLPQRQQRQSGLGRPSQRPNGAPAVELATMPNRNAISHPISSSRAAAEALAAMELRRQAAPSRPVAGSSSSGGGGSNSSGGGGASSSAAAAACSMMVAEMLARAESAASVDEDSSSDDQLETHEARGSPWAIDDSSARPAGRPAGRRQTTPEAWPDMDRSRSSSMGSSLAAGTVSRGGQRQRHARVFPVSQTSPGSSGSSGAPSSAPGPAAEPLPVDMLGGFFSMAQDIITAISPVSTERSDMTTHQTSSGSNIGAPSAASDRTAN